jgi:RsiW-degrading membrane proteinase PrsW (M82 family)
MDIKNKITPNKITIQSLSDNITDKLGLEKIEGFSLSGFFSEALKKHHESEIEKILSVGTAQSTPKPNASMGNMPNPWLFFKVLSTTALAYFIFLFAWDEYKNIHLVPGLIMIGSFAVPLSVLILFFELNTPRNISIIKILELVILGGAISLLLSLFLYEVTPIFGVFGNSAAGIIEEAAKLGALLFVIRNVEKDRYKYRLNALLLGASIGTGFAAFESAGYALQIGLVDSHAMLSNIKFRGIMSPFAHIAWSAIAASAFWIAKQKHNNTIDTIQSKDFLKFFLVPVALHFTWNLPFEGPFMLKYFVLGFVAWVVIISLMQSGLKEMSTIK